MKIAICGDNQQDNEYLKKMILESEACPAELDFYEFYTGYNALAAGVLKRKSYYWRGNKDEYRTDFI